MARGGGFEVKVGGKWVPYAEEVSEILEHALWAGRPSVRFLSEQRMFKFDFRRLQQKDLLTGAVCELRLPPGLEPPPPLCGIRGLGPRPALAVRVPRDAAAGKAIDVPHPKKLGKVMRVPLPERAAGGVVLVDVPSNAQSLVLSATAGTAAGAALAAGVVAGEHAIAAGGAGAVAALGAMASAGGPVLAGGAALAGIALVGAAGVAAVNAARANPVQAAAAGAAVIGGLAAADYVAEHGVAAAAADAAHGARVLVAGAWEAGQDVTEAAGAVDWKDTVDWAGSSGDPFQDLVQSLF